MNAPLLNRKCSSVFFLTKSHDIMVNENNCSFLSTKSVAQTHFQASFDMV